MRLPYCDGGCARRLGSRSRAIGRVFGERLRLGGRGFDYGDLVVVLVVQRRAAQTADLRHDGFHKPLGDFPGVKALAFRVQEDLNKLVGRDADTGFFDDFGCLAEDGKGVFVEGDSDAGRLGDVHGFIW